MTTKKKRMAKEPHVVALTCCGERVKVTRRKSKLAERPRKHQCPKCGRFYNIGISNVNSGVANPH